MKSHENASVPVMLFPKFKTKNTVQCRRNNFMILPVSSKFDLKSGTLSNPFAILVEYHGYRTHGDGNKRQ